MAESDSELYKSPRSSRMWHTLSPLRHLDAVALVRAERQNLLCVLPTNSGKTLIATELIARVLNREPTRKVVYAVPNGALARQTFIDNLIWAADIAPKGLTLTVEPLNPVAMPGYFMNDYALAADVLRAVNRPNVRLQYDSYHAQMIHGDAVAVFEQYKDLIVHVQLGDAPDRSAPGTGTVDFPALFAALRRAGYRGWVSGEYIPGPRTEDSLGWMTLS